MTTASSSPPPLSSTSPITTNNEDPETGATTSKALNYNAIPFDEDPVTFIPTTTDGTSNAAAAANAYHSIPESGDASNVGFLLSACASTTLHAYSNSAPFSGILFCQTMEQETTDRIASSAAAGSWRQQQQFPSGWSFFNPSQRLAFVQACYLGVAAIFGTLLRLILAQLFGQACQNPGTIGWIADDAALCVTSNGNTSQQGGIIFADLPANMIGSFLMGFLQDGAALELAIHAPLVFVPPQHVLQAYSILHLALKTGFCGSLTTFSGWNSEMVIMLVGREVTDRTSQVWKAILGYVIGVETALGSYVFGRTVAWWWHQWHNPDLALEQEAMKIKQYQHGMAINHKLPTLERRYLHKLFELPYTTDSTLVPVEMARRLSPAETLTPQELMPLSRWRDSTQEARRTESGLAQSLIDLETIVIANKQVLSPEMRSTAQQHGWDIAALEMWMAKRNDPQPDHALSSLNNKNRTGNHCLDPAGIRKEFSEETSLWYSIPVAALSWTSMIAILVILVVHWNAETSYDITYRTMAYSMLYATPGALLRWKLSAWNGKLNSFDWKWLPIGTLAANVLGSMVSITMMACEYNVQVSDYGNGFWPIATLRAIKIGFSGCLTTVSTFISEVHKLTQMRQDRGYKYVVLTLISSCILATVLFVIIV